MKKLLIVLLLTALFFSCKNDDTPDVSNIKVNLAVHRFEKDFFAIDTNNILDELQRLRIKYPALSMILPARYWALIIRHLPTP